MKEYQALFVRITPIDKEWTVRIVHTKGATTILMADEYRALKLAVDFSVRLGLPIWKD